MILAAAMVVALAPSAVAMTCIPEADFLRLGPNLETYVHEIAGDDGTKISLYFLGYRSEENGVDEEILEVVRTGDCINSLATLTGRQVSERYELYASWTELEEAASGDSEGLGEGEGNVVADVYSYPFTSLEEYKVKKIYSGPVGRPDFKGRDKEFSTFRTRILEGMKQGPNFGGEYAVTQIGCGSSCSIAIVSNLRTGEQFDFPRGGEEVGPMSLKHSANSRLLIATLREGEQCVLETMVFNGKQWDVLSKAPIGNVDVCYDDIDQNVEEYAQKLSSSAAGDETTTNEGNFPGRLQATAPNASKEVPAKIADGMTEYDNINVAALLDLYEAHDALLACFKAREGQPMPYLTRSVMEKVDAAFRRDEAVLLQREPGMDKDAIARKAYELNKMFDLIVMASGKIQPSYEHQNACNKLAALFPPGIENARLKRR